MRIGLVADTHDNMLRIRQAVAVFDSIPDLKMVLHAGDHVAPFSLEPWKALKCPFYGVFGNNDGERKGLSEKSEGRISGERLTKNLLDKRLLLVHEREKAEVLVAAGGQRIDVVVFGHTHEPEIWRDPDTGVLWVNPGECGGWLTGRATVAILDMESLGVEIVDLGSTTPASSSVHHH